MSRSNRPPSLTSRPRRRRLDGDHVHRYTTRPSQPRRHHVTRSPQVMDFCDRRRGRRRRSRRLARSRSHDRLVRLLRHVGPKQSRPAPEPWFPIAAMTATCGAHKDRGSPPSPGAHGHVTVRLGGSVRLGPLPAWLSPVPRVTLRVTGRVLRASGKICLRERGGKVRTSTFPSYPDSSS